MKAKNISLDVKKQKELRSAAAGILKAFPEERIFALSGDLGAGKTTMIKAFCGLLGVADIVTSPTFAIVNEYKAEGDQMVYHFDFYRINKLEEVMDIGFEEYLSSGCYCFLEWPEKITELLPPGFVKIKIGKGPGEEERFIEAFVESESILLHKRTES